MLRIVLMALALALGSAASGTSETPAETTRDTRPNIVLVLFEDMSSRVGAFGDPLAHTPHFDRVALEGVRYPNTFTVSGVCAPSRAGLITSRYPQTIGAQHMRTHGVMGMSGGGPFNYNAVPPPEVRAFPELLRAAGYFVTNNAKTDYQFGEPFTIWDETSDDAHWRNRPEGAPFFAMFTLMETHESYLWPVEREAENPVQALVQARNARELAGMERRTDPAEVSVPPYFPDTPEVRGDLALFYDLIAHADGLLGELLAELEEDGLMEETIIIVSTDHGDGLPRAKRSVYDSGIRVPMAIRFAGGGGAGEVQTELVSFLDLGPTILSWAGIEVPDWMHGQAFEGAARAPEREYVFAVQDRMDSVMNHRRAVRDSRYKLIVNFRPSDPYFSPLAFRDNLPTMQALWAAHADGSLPEAARPLFEPLPEHQLFDVITDPHEIHNLAGQPEYAEVEARLRARLDAWLAEVGDSSRTPEDEMAESFWPGGVQPVTPAPHGQLEDGRLVLETNTLGASLGWRCEGEARWRLYTGAVETGCGRIEAGAQRYGWAKSRVIVIGPH